MAETKDKDDVNHIEEDRDRISQLTYELLILILTFLNLMEAGRTCVLSKRWKHLRSLDIDCVSTFRPQSLVAPLFHLVHITVPYVHVDRVLHLHQGAILDELNIRSCLVDEKAHHANNWVEFAFKKKVKRRELDMKGEIVYYHDIKFVFPTKPWEFLTHLSLIFVNVGCEVIKQLLSKCQLLEELCVRGCTYLYSVRLVDPSLKLKSLIISGECYKLVIIKISTSNLVSFTYEGAGPSRWGISVIRAPSLVNVYLIENFNCITKPFTAIESCFVSNLSSIGEDRCPSL